MFGIHWIFFLFIFLIFKCLKLKFLLSFSLSMTLKSANEIHCCFLRLVSGFLFSINLNSIPWNLHHHHDCPHIQDTISLKKSDWLFFYLFFLWKFNTARSIMMIIINFDEKKTGWNWKNQFKIMFQKHKIDRHFLPFKIVVNLNKFHLFIHVKFFSALLYSIRKSRSNAKFIRWWWLLDSSSGKTKQKKNFVNSELKIMHQPTHETTEFDWLIVDKQKTKNPFTDFWKKTEKSH